MGTAFQSPDRSLRAEPGPLSPPSFTALSSRSSEPRTSTSLDAQARKPKSVWFAPGLPWARVRRCPGPPWGVPAAPGGVSLASFPQARCVYPPHFLC